MVGRRRRQHGVVRRRRMSFTCMQAILKSLPVPVRVSRPDGRIEFVNRAFSETFGYALADIPTLEDWWRLAYPDPQYRAESMLVWAGYHTPPGAAEQAMHKPTRAIVCKDGTVRTAELTFAPSGDRHVLVLSDISERLGRERELEEAEKRLQTIIANSEAIIYQVAPDGTFLMADGLALARLGRKAGEAVGHNMRSRYADDPALLGCLREALAGQRAACMMRGNKHTFHNVMTPLLDGRGHVTSVIGIATDVTELVAARERAEASEKKFRSLFESLSAGVALYEMAYDDGRAVDYMILDVNPAFERILGIPRDKAVEAWGTELYGRRPPPYLEIYARVAAGGGPERFETFHAPSGRHLSISVVSPRTGQFATVIEDISERRRFLDEIQRREEKFRAIFDTAAVGIVLTDAQGRIIECNRRFPEMLGYPLEELLEASILDHTHSEDVAATREGMERLRAGRDTQYVIPKRYLRRDGASLWTIASASRIDDAHGRMVNSVAVILDISDRKREEERYRVLFDSAKDGIFVLKDGLIADCNLAGMAMLSCSREEIIGRVPASFSPPLQPDGRSWKAASREVFTRMKAGSVVFEWLHRNCEGADFPAEVSSTPMDLFGEELILCFVRDITERKRMQDLMVQSEKMLSLGGLAAGMAHEINNPLGIVLQGVQNILRRVDPDQPANQAVAARYDLELGAVRSYFEERNILRYLTGIREAGERAAVIVQNMLDFSRRSDSAKALNDLSGILDHTLDIAASDYDLKKKYDFRHVEIARAYAPDLPQVRCSATEIEQVVFNILRNAAQAMAEAGTPAPRLTLTTGLDQGYARVVIEDNGPGMTREALAHIFEPFYTTKKAGEGTGLGLSVSYFIITTNHRGQIFAESEPGRGTRFTIRLPLGDGR